MLFGPFRFVKPMGWIGGRYRTSNPSFLSSGSLAMQSLKVPCLPGTRPWERGNISYHAANSADFLSTVCQAWEKEALQARGKARVLLLRIGVVLGKNGGALATMLPAFRLGVGGKLGHGRQWFPWIHLNDLTRAIIFLMESKGIHGPVNLSAPRPVRNKEFTRCLGQALHRPTFLTVPRLAIRLVLGELSSVVLEGCRMMPGVLLENGFTFRFPEVTPAVEEIVGKNKG